MGRSETDEWNTGWDVQRTVRGREVRLGRDCVPRIPNDVSSHIQCNSSPLGGYQLTPIIVINMITDPSHLAHDDGMITTSDVIRCRANQDPCDDEYSCEYSLAQYEKIRDVGLSARITSGATALILDELSNRPIADGSIDFSCLEVLLNRSLFDFCFPSSQDFTQSGSE
jgi:hypothetical protein